MHFSLLHQTEGYSLSRLNSFEAGIHPENWISTASQATPGLNQASKMNNTSQEAFYSHPKSVSPNQDGFQDYIFFTLANPSENLWTKLSIHNWEGLLVKEFEPTLLNPQIPSFRWDGINQKGEITTAGLYQAILKTQDEQGIRKVYRCSFAVF
jgi:flagellar hook assembly protein FlgD